MMTKTKMTKQKARWLLAGLVPASGLAAAFTVPGINTPPAPNGRVEYVSTGTITTTSTPSGVVQPTTELSLDFPTSGVVDHVYVQAGQRVRAGQLLATVVDPSLQTTVEGDQSSLLIAEANLAKTTAPTPSSVAQAQASLDAAKAQLANLQAGGTPASVAQAAANLDAARSKLTALGQGTPSTILTAQSTLDAAKQKLASMQQGGTVAAVAQAQASLDSAQAQLGALQAGGTQDAVAQAQAALSEQQAKLVSMQQGGYLLKKPGPGRQGRRGGVAGGRLKHDAEGLPWN